MKHLSLISLFLLSFNLVFSQQIDLCGIWLGNNYNCYTLNPVTGQAEAYTLTEVIEIQTIGDTTYATKITGDDCVTAGQITWKGIISDSQSTVFVTVGAPESPNSSIIENPLIVVSPTFLDLAFTGLTFQKANCIQIDSLIYHGIISDSKCIDCEVHIPNVFSPNGDFANDNFEFTIGNKLAVLNFQILNRWGEIVYQTEDQTINWNGESNGIECTEGIYFWQLKYFLNYETIYISGFLTLIR